MVREGRVFKSQSGSGKPEYGAGFLVTAYEVGAEVSQGSIGTTIDVRAGHGFADGDKFIVGIDATRYRRVINAQPETLEIDSNVPVAAGELLVNLGQDSGTLVPEYNSNSVQIYLDMDYSNLYANSTLASDNVGRYRYHHRGISRWELVRIPAGEPFAIYTDTGNPMGETQGDLAISGDLSSDTLEVANSATIGSLDVNSTLSAQSVIAVSLTITGDSTIGNNDTDIVTNVGRMVFRTVAADPTGASTLGTIGEVVYSSTTQKFYGKHTTSASDTNWRLLGT